MLPTLLYHLLNVVQIQYLDVRGRRCRDFGFNGGLLFDTLEMRGRDR